MGAKSRGNWNVSVCLKDCANKDKHVQGAEKETYCNLCVRFSLLKPRKKTVSK